MQLFLDSANTADWHLPAGCPPLAGVTTNPTLVYQAGLPVTLATYLGLIDAAATRKIPVLMLQIPHSEVARGLAMAHTLRAAAGVQLQLTFKLPCHLDWQALHSALRGAGFSTLFTGLSNAMQLLWAQSQQASYVAPYLARLAADGRDVSALIQACVAVQNVGGPKLMAASVKTADLFCQLLAAGAAAVTVKHEFATSLAQDTLANAAFAQFERDIAASGG